MATGAQNICAAPGAWTGEQRAHAAGNGLPLRRTGPCRTASSLW
jgi:hypothetical protein